MASSPIVFAQPSADMSDAKAPLNEEAAGSAVPTPAPAAAPAPAPAPDPASAPTSEPVGEAATSSEPPAWKHAMTLYELGQADEALTLLRQKVMECDDEVPPQCSDAERAALYMCVGIVLSGGKANHPGGVQAFKKALLLDDTMRVAPQYAMEPVTRAFAEAQGTPQSPAPVAEVSSTYTAENDPDFSELPAKKGRLFFLASGTAKIGWGTLYEYYGYDYDDYDYYSYDSAAMGQLGGGLTLAGMPGTSSGFTLGARIRGGGLFGDRQTVGYVGGNLFLGGTLGRRQDNDFIFLLGGAGIESFPGRGTSAATAHFLGGVSMGGFVVGASADFGISYDVAYALFGLEVGFAQLY